MDENESKNNPFSKFNREELEDQALKSLKYIKNLRKQNTEILEVLKQTEEKLLVQIQENDELKAENQKLQAKSSSDSGISSLTSSPSSPLAAATLSLGNIGRKFTAILNQKPDINLTLNLQIDEFSINADLANNESNGEELPQVTLLKSQIAQLKQSLSKSHQNELSIREFASTLQTKLENKEYQEEELNSCRDQLKESQNRFDEVCIKNENLLQKVELLESELNQVKKNSSEIQSQFSSLQQSSSDLNQLMEKYSTLIEQHETLKSDTIQQRIKIQESQRQIEQLKESLKKSMRMDQEKDEQIRQFSQQIKENENEKTDLKHQIEGLTKLISIRENEIRSSQQEKESIIERLNSGKGTIETEAKIQKMQRLIEKSNSLYAEMQMKASQYEERVHELEKQIHNDKIKARGLPIMQVITPNGNFILYDGGTYGKFDSKQISDINDIQTFDFNSRPNVANQENSLNRVDIGVLTSTSANEIEEKYEYLKKLVIQYFRSDQKIKTQLTPVILNLLNISQFEIKKIMSGNNNGIFSFF
ncbi:hypothetical protein M9Y10_009208 [Tritrichomonas musculus]|uniref:GRIP domain-containing protein n=1 Tax=Tritrichomonas musculus TaxID=1915356 RepID=A0ABR2IMP3_9EUKA